MFKPFPITPGIYKDYTDYLAEPHYVDSNFVRFQGGVAEQMGGWLDLLPTSDNLIGVPRTIERWTLNNGRKAICVATNKKIYIYIGGILTDVTPIRATVSLAFQPFSATAGSTVVEVTSVNHGAAVGDYVTFSGAEAVDGVDLNGNFEILEIIDVDTYTITATSVIASTVIGGGAAVTAAYEVAAGRSTSTTYGGWGTGFWGAGTWGTPRDTDGSEFISGIRLWTLEPWGEDLLLMPSGGELYVWDATSPSSRPTLVANAPTTNSFFIVTEADQHVIVFGANGDPRLIKWCNQGDYNDWTIEQGSTAGERKVFHGSSFRAAYEVRNETLIWTNSGDVFRMTFTGAIDFAFNLEHFSSQAPIVSRQAAVQYGDTLYWMGEGHFFRYSGSISVLESSVDGFMFRSINRTQQEKVIAGLIQKEGEVLWFFPTETENSAYVKFNIEEDVWDYGTLARSAWLGERDSAYPIACSPDGRIYEHEKGITANGAPLESFLTTSDMDISEGDQVTFVRRVMPDLEGAAEFTFLFKRQPLRAAFSKGPYAITDGMGYINARARGRLMSYRIDGTGSFWKLGKIQLDLNEDGGQ